MSLRLDKLGYLLDLKSRVENEYGKNNVWFWEEGEKYPDKFSSAGKKVKGYFGTGKIFIISEKPTNYLFPDRGNILFYNTLGEFGLDNAHITDLIKTRGKAGVDISLEANDHWKYLQEEMEIISPKIIVSTTRRLQRWLRESKGIASDHIIFYTHAIRFDKKKIFRNQIKEISSKFYLN